MMSMDMNETNEIRKILVVIGTRPEAIKMCPVIKELKKRTCFNTVVCVTAQHREMLDQVLKVFDVVPQYDLNVMRDGQSLFDITKRVLGGIKEVMENVKPDIVLVHGDTTTTFVSALASFYLKIPVGHVEAGLRTNDIYSPFPEEFNRHAVSIISQINFAPTEIAKLNLLKEGIVADSVVVTGNTAIDALNTTVVDNYSHPELEWSNGKRLILITAHRRENLGESMRNMFRALKRILDENENTCALYPIHKNPIIREIADEIFKGSDRIHIIEPLDVFDFHNIMNRCFLVMTDSGGIQEEAPHLGKPVLVLRNTTERPEGIEAGTLELVGTDENNIYNSICELLNNNEKYLKMSNASNPYGDGLASKKIADILEGIVLEPH